MIYLRQIYSREPTEDEIALALTKKQVEAKNEYKSVTAQEVERAYDEGKQVFLVLAVILHFFSMRESLKSMLP